MRFNPVIYDPHTPGPKPKHTDPEFYLKILESYEEGYTLKELADQNDVTCPTILNWIRKARLLG